MIAEDISDNKNNNSNLQVKIASYTRFCEDWRFHCNDAWKQFLLTITVHGIVLGLIFDKDVQGPFYLVPLMGFLTFVNAMAFALMQKSRKYAEVCSEKKKEIEKEFGLEPISQIGKTRSSYRLMCLTFVVIFGLDAYIILYSIFIIICKN